MTAVGRRLMLGLGGGVSRIYVRKKERYMIILYFSIHRPHQRPKEIWFEENAFWEDQQTDIMYRVKIITIA